MFPNFFQRNNGSEVAGVPSWYELSNDWEISEKDLRYLQIGPLVQNGKVLVPALPDKNLKQQVWQVIGMVSTLGGAVTFIFWLFGG